MIKFYRRSKNKTASVQSRTKTLTVVRRQLLPPDDVLRFVEHPSVPKLRVVVGDGGPY